MIERVDLVFIRKGFFFATPKSIFRFVCAAYFSMPPLKPVEYIDFLNLAKNSSRHESFRPFRIENLFSVYMGFRIDTI